MGKEKQSAGRHGEEFWAQESKSNIGFKLMTAQGWQQGEGLGKGGGGRTNFIRAKKKTDVLGLGAKQGEDDSWSAMTGLYNELLQRLSVEGGVHEDGGVSKVAVEEDTSKTLQDYIVKKRLDGRFRKAKDTCGYSENDMAAIMGKKTEPTTPKPDQLGYTRAVTAVATVEKKEGDDGSGVTTVTSKMSIRDYFQKKMSLGGSRYSAAGGVGFTEEFQESHFNKLTQVADSYSGKMGLGSGRSSDPWEQQDNYRTTFSSPPAASSDDKKTKEKKSEVVVVAVAEEKPKKSKKKRESSPAKEIIEQQPATKSKKSKKDSSSSSSSSSSTPLASSSSSSSSSSLVDSSGSSSSKKSKKTKEVVVPVVEVEKSVKKSKKTKIVEEPAEEKLTQKVKKDKKSKKQEEEVKKCSFCSSLDVPNTCGGCQRAFYCGIACQTSHWATHKLKCKLQC